MSLDENISKVKRGCEMSENELQGSNHDPNMLFFIE